MVSFVIPGRPMTQNRLGRTKTGRTYQTKELKAWRAMVTMIALQAGLLPICGKVTVHITVALRVLKNTCPEGTLIGTPRRYDCENVAKALNDALGWAYDDGNVCDLHVAKVQSESDKVFVSITEVE